MTTDPNEPRWPADDPWWRFTPRSLPIGYFSLAAAGIALIWSVWSLLAGGIGTAQTVLFIILALIAVLWLVQTANGLKALLRRRR